jgi:Tol biopolymer transport system component
MNSRIVMLIVALLWAGLHVITAGQTEADVEKLLASAHRRATLDGDLKGAIGEYENVVAAAGQNRAVAAKALIQMADCYQKLGDTEARKILERVLREYSDQTEAAAIARARLGRTEPPATTRGDRSVWAGPRVDGFGTISPDGRFLTYTDWWTTGGLVLRELASGNERRLTSGSYADGQTLYSAISRDGRQVAYQWFRNDKKRYELRVASLQGTGMPESSRVLDLEDAEGIAPYDWSPDGKWLAAFVERADRTGQLGLVGVKDGSLRVLKSVDWMGPTKIFFSPDGQYIAYDLSVGDTSRERHIFVMTVDGSSETAVVAHPSENVITGWSPDGRYILFASDRSGSFGLWGQPVAGGRAQGTPKFLKPDIGSTWSLGLTRSGTMYVWTGSPTYLEVASIDLDAGKIAPRESGPLQHFIGSRGRPDWSADGKYLAYSSCGLLGGGPCTIIVRSMDTGELRELRPKLQYFFFPRWAPDSRSFVTQGTDLKGRRGAYRIDAQTGEVSTVGMPVSTAGMPQEFVRQWSADGTAVYFGKSDDQHLEIVRHDLATGRNDEVVRLARRGVPPNYVFGFSVSPDERAVAIVSTDRKDPAEQTLTVVTLGAAESKPLLRVTSPQFLFGAQFQDPAWTPDSRALIVGKSVAATNDVAELWLVPVDGSDPRKLQFDSEHFVAGEGFRLSPDGRQIAFIGQAGAPGYEIRALENFLPGLPAKK